MTLHEREGVGYDPETGIIIGRQGRPVGSINKVNGYVMTHFDKRTVYVHRLAYFIMTGTWPEGDMDHVNGNRTDNRWSNLRVATRQQNLFNKRSTRELPKNVYRHSSGRYRVKMQVGGATRHFGYFDDLEAAEFVASLVQERYHGEFAPAYG